MQTRSIKGSRIFFLDRIIFLLPSLYSEFSYRRMVFSNPLETTSPRMVIINPLHLHYLRLYVPPVLIAGLVFFIGRDWNAGVFQRGGTQPPVYRACSTQGDGRLQKNYSAIFSAIRLNWKESLLLVAIFILGLIPRLLLLKPSN